MTRPIFYLLTVALFATACGDRVLAPAAPAHVDAIPANSVRMDADAQARMGVATTQVSPASAAQTIQGFARVLDVGPLAAIESEVAAASSAAAASEAEYQRLAVLATQDNAASARSVEAARAQAAADSARARLASRRIGLEWGQGLETLSATARSKLVTEIAAGRAALLRLDVSTIASVARASVRLDKDGSGVPVAILGAAAAADPRLQTPGLLGVVRGDNARTLPNGRLLQADFVLGAADAGFMLPNAALVRTDKSVFVYVRRGPDIFERRDVSAGRPTASGWFIANGFSTSDEIVAEGAASLLAVESGPAEAED